MATFQLISAHGQLSSAKQGSFRGNAVPIVQSVKERILDGIANHFPTKYALDRRILHIQSQHFFGGDTPGPPQ